MNLTHNYANNLKKKFLCIFLTLILLMSISSQVFALSFLWNSPVIPDSAGEVGEYTSMAVVNGMPAISYYDHINGALKFVRATNANGTAWGTVLTLDSTDDVGEFTSLAVINGFLAISYFAITNGCLKFIRATDTSGSAWGAPQLLDSTYGSGVGSSLAEVNGMPAISYGDFDNLKFIRAADANGTTWNTPMLLDSSITDTSLVVINGVPAISYSASDSGDLKFIRATDASGSTWGTPLTLDSVGNTGDFPSLATINGVPAISYLDRTNSDLKFIRAADADGTVWNAPQTLDSIGLVGWTSSLAMVNGTPAISYFDNGNSDLKFIHAADANGTSWNVPQTLDSTGTVGAYTSLVVVNGLPAISYWDMSNHDLRYIRSNGTVDFYSQLYSNGDTFDFGSTTLGLPITDYIVIRNRGTATLNLKSLVLPDGFSLIDTYKSEITSGAYIVVQIRLDALQIGTFSGDLEIINTDTNQSPFIITLTGEVTTSNGEIAVFDGATEIVDNTGSVDYGTTIVGTPISHTFTIQNSSSEALELYSLTIPSGFSLSGAYNHTIASGGSTNITIQLDSQITGSYSGGFSLSTNDLDENPFNFTLSGEVDNPLLETGIIAPLNGSTVLDSEMQVSFNHDVLHDGSADAANNPANYLLVEDGANGLFETSTCLLGLAGDDVQVTISSVTYNASTFTATMNAGTLSSGRYRLFVCGTASIADATGNVLNNGAFDSATTFTVVSASSGSISASGAVAAGLPATGFAPNQITYLKEQPAAAAYSDMDSLRLQIPSLNVDVPIVGVPQTSNGWDVTWLTTAQAGWLNGSAYPTWAGNTVLTGHVTNASGNPGPFANIKTLKFGDQITIQAYGEEYVYEVRENKLVTRDNLSVIEKHENHDWISLVTCEYFNESTGEYLYRRMVRAVLVEVE